MNIKSEKRFAKEMKDTEFVTVQMSKYAYQMFLNACGGCDMESKDATRLCETHENTEPQYAFMVAPLSKEDGGGYAICYPDCPGCVSDGKTVEEAIAMGKDALASWMNAQNDVYIPPPRTYNPYDIVEKIRS